jgi:hypothetical protein
MATCLKYNQQILMEFYVLSFSTLTSEEVTDRVKY